MYKVIKLKAPVKDYEIHFPKGNLVFLTNSNVDVDLAINNPSSPKIRLNNKEFIRTDFNFIYITSAQTGDIELIVADKEFKIGTDYKGSIDSVNTINSVSQVGSISNVNNVFNVERVNSVTFSKVSVNETGVYLSYPVGTKRIVLTNTGASNIYLSNDGTINGYTLKPDQKLEIQKAENFGFYAVCDALTISELSIMQEG